MLEKLQNILGHGFGDEALLEQALRHASTTEQRTKSNERLEFLGDRVLGIVIAETLYTKFPTEQEGELARRFAGLTSRDALERVGDSIHLVEFAHTQQVDAKTAARNHASVVSDTLEAILGALYLDGGLDVAASFIQNHWEALIGEDLSPPKDAKTALQEWAQARGQTPPVYSEQNRSGPDHAPVFTVEARMQLGEAARAEARSKRQAEQAAAQALLDRLGAG